MDNSGLDPAPYGHACVSCVQAKCKCLVAEVGGSCARECQPARRIRKVNPVRRSVAAKTAQLERRLDELTSLLQTRQPNPLATTTGAAPSDSGFSSASQAPGGSTSLGKSSSGNTPDIEPSGDLLVDDDHATDQEILDDFRSHRLQYLPFIYIPRTTCVTEIKERSPFLWRCMVALHCKDTLQRAALHTQLTSTAAQALLVDCHRSFDLLQGLLIYLGSIAFECQPRKMSLGPYMQMVTSLVLDIGLNKAPPKTPDFATALFVKSGPSSCRPWVSLVRTMEERRAVLGYFLVCSALCHTLGRTESPRWTPHMKECLDVLAEAKEAPDDAVLVQLVCAQLVVDRVSKDLGYDFQAVDDRGKATLSFYVKGLQSQLNDARNLAPPELSENKIVQLHMYHAETTTYETAMAQSASRDEVDFTRLDHLYACLNAVRKRFDVLLSLPAMEFAYLPYTIVFPTANSLITLLRLSTFEYPGWDLVVVRQTANLLALTQQVADKFAQAADAAGIRNPPDGDMTDCFTTVSRILSGLRAGWASRFPDLESMAPTPERIPPLPEIDQRVVESWLLSQDSAWLSEPALGWPW